MKIAVTANGPELGSGVEARFGRCRYFVIVDTDTMQSEGIENPNTALGGGAGIQSAQLMAQKGVGTVLTGNCGPNAFQVFGAAGIQVIVGVSGTVGEAVEKLKTGSLNAAEAPNVDSHFGMGASGGAGGQFPDGTAGGGDMGMGGGRGMGRGMGMGGGGGMGRGMGMGGGGGMGRGMGMGRGGGMGRGMGMGGDMQSAPQQGPASFSAPQQAQQPLSREQELAMLRQQSEAMQSQIAEVNKRIDQLQTETSAGPAVAHVAAERCIGCGRCEKVCPQSAISIVGGIAQVNEAACNGCGLCVRECPRAAIAL